LTDVFRRGRREREHLAVAFLALAVTVVGCSSSSLATEPVRPKPSARQFCNARAGREVSTSVGVPMLRVPRPRADARHYACTYDFSAGRIRVSVTELPDAGAARESLAAIARVRGRRPEPPMLGEELDAFVTTDGSMIVRKGRDVLDVDVAHLPPEFGRPPQTRSVIALAVAVTTIGHWVPG
jgi:hypothetical protein